MYLFSYIFGNRIDSVTFYMFESQRFLILFYNLLITTYLNFVVIHFKNYCTQIYDKTIIEMYVHCICKYRLK